MSEQTLADPNGPATSSQRRTLWNLAARAGSKVPRDMTAREADRLIRECQSVMSRGRQTARQQVPA